MGLIYHIIHVAHGGCERSKSAITKTNELDGNHDCTCIFNFFSNIVLNPSRPTHIVVFIFGSNFIVVLFIFIFLYFRMQNP